MISLPLSDVNSSTSTADVSILGQFGADKIFYQQFQSFPLVSVTEPSPEVPVGPNINANQTLIHHVIVHRESEEYQTDFDDMGDGARRSKLKETSHVTTELNYPKLPLISIDLSLP